MATLKLKPTKNKSKAKLSQNILIIALVVAMVLTVMVVNFISSSALNDVVEIAVLKESLPKDGIINSLDQFAKIEMQSMEYERQSVVTRGDGSVRREVILWSDLDRVLKQGAYAGVYMHANRPIYWSDLSATGTQKNSYLYQMDGELIKLNISPAEFGNMVVPGDKLNVRITYSTTDFALPTDVEYDKMQAGVLEETEVLVTEMLFSEVAILDMLSSGGESIFDLYYELLSLPEAQRTEIINSEEFKSRVAPSNILLSVTAEEADRYAQIGSRGGSYLITLLPRDGTSEILDALDELQVGFARDTNG